MFNMFLNDKKRNSEQRNIKIPILSNQFLHLCNYYWSNSFLIIAPILSLSHAATAIDTVKFIIFSLFSSSFHVIGKCKVLLFACIFYSQSLAQCLSDSLINDC